MIILVFDITRHLLIKQTLTPASTASSLRLLFRDNKDTETQSTHQLAHLLGRGRHGAARSTGTHTAVGTVAHSGTASHTAVQCSTQRYSVAHSGTV